MTTVLSHPWSEEVEDYKAYKRLRVAAQEKRVLEASVKRDSKPGPALTGSDGTGDSFPSNWVHPFRDSAVKVEDAVEVHEDETAESPRGSVVVTGMPRARSSPSAGRGVLRDITP